MAQSFFTGLLGSFRDAAAGYRADARKLQEDQDTRELDVLKTLATSDRPEIASAAATAMLDIASGVKKPKGGFLARLVGPSEVSTHPAVAQIMQTLRQPSPQKIEGPPVGSISFDTPPGPGSAAMPPPPPQGNPGTVPPGMQAAPGGPPPLPPLPANDLPVGNQVRLGTSTARHAGTTVPGPPRPIWDAPEEKAIRAARAKAQGDVEGEIAGMIAAGFTEAEARQIYKDSTIRARTGSSTPPGWAEGEIIQKPDGSWVQTLYLRTDPSRRMEIPAMAPGQRSVAAPNERAILAKELFGSRYPQYANDPAGLLRSLTPQEAGQLDATLRTRGVTQTGREAYTRAFNAGDAAADIPLSTSQKWDATTAEVTRWTKAQEATKALAETLNIMEVGLARLEQDPIGGVEFIRVPFAKIADNLSVVRESEFNRQTNALSALDRLVGWVQKQLDGGGNIPVEMLREMVTTARMVRDRQAGSNDALRAQIDERARRWGLNPLDIFGSGSTGSSAPPPPPGSTTGPPPPAGAPTLGSFVGATGQEVAPRTPVERKPDPDTPGQFIYIVRVNGRPVEVEFRDGKYYYK